ncbi:hypothetical protein BGZ65_011167, partial [Modicella reniformis]
LTSIPDAIAAFGGACSVMWGLFHFFFGVGRLNPFGIISRRLLREKTQRRLAETYGYCTLQSVTIEPQEKAPNNASVNGENLTVIDEKLKQLDQRTQGNIEKVEEDLKRLEGLLRDYYLDMDIARVDNPTNRDSGRWY